MEKLERYYETIRAGRPELKFCERFDDASSLWNFTRHSHPFIELMYFTEGRGGLEVSGRKMSTTLYDTVIYPANWTHQEEAAAERRREIICLWVSLPELELDGPIQLHDQNGELSALFHAIHREFKRDRPEPVILEYRIKLLLTTILRNRSESQGQEGVLTCVLQYIHMHCAEPVTLDRLAAMEHISKSYLSRLFKQQTGQTVISYINSLRIETAKRLLTSTRASVSEIAYQVGFESPKYFYRVFRTLTGQTPSAFRKQYRNARGFEPLQHPPVE
ncbi:MAG: helix-turn-helix domain-containing protein [Oscillospiraceae bacterium]|nr:helix-turn-helix domain-containing protein [Oscillospiraceae bacterium]